MALAIFTMKSSAVKALYVRIIQAVENMVELGVPFRLNCTMSKPVVSLLPEIAKKAIQYGANAV